MARYRKRQAGSRGAVEAFQWHGEKVAGLPRIPVEDARGEKGFCLVVKQGDWIVREEDRLFPCKPDVFAATYEPAEE